MDKIGIILCDKWRFIRLFCYHLFWKYRFSLHFQNFCSQWQLWSNLNFFWLKFVLKKVTCIIFWVMVTFSGSLWVDSLKYISSVLSLEIILLSNNFLAKLLHAQSVLCFSAFSNNILLHLLKSLTSLLILSLKCLDFCAKHWETHLLYVVYILQLFGFFTSNATFLS